MKKKEDLVKGVIEVQENLNTLTVDNINKTSVSEPEPQELSLQQIAAKEGALWIKPLRRLSPPLGTLPEKLKRDHARDWEYVKGIFENYIINGEPLRFSFNGVYPGDADYLWEIPTNRPIYVPRMIAKHLESVMVYHKFSDIEKPQNQWGPDSFTHTFQATETHFRGKFRPIGAFA